MARMTKLGLGLILATLAAALPGAASAQIGSDSDAPIEITSETSEYLQKEGVILFLNNVIATQADARITTNKLTATCMRAQPAAGQSIEDQPCEELRQIVAEGDVLYTAPDVKIRGDRAEYDYTTDTITITGDVVLSRGAEGVVRGTKVVYQVGAGHTSISSDKDRVMAIFESAKPRNSTPNPPATQPAPTPN
jgi:lipopolysaccharide export system protein LptA